MQSRTLKVGIDTAEPPFCLNASFLHGALAGFLLVLRAKQRIVTVICQSLQPAWINRCTRALWEALLPLLSSSPACFLPSSIAADLPEFHSVLHSKSMIGISLTEERVTLRHQVETEQELNTGT